MGGKGGGGGCGGGSYFYRGKVAAVSVEDALDDATDTGDVVGDLCFREDRALGGPAAGVADEAGGAAEERDCAVATALEPGEDDDAEEVAEVDGVGGRVKPDVNGEGLGGGHAAEVVGGHILDELTLAEDVEDVPEGRGRGGVCGCSWRLDYDMMADPA